MDEAALVKKSVLTIFDDHGYDDPSKMTQRDFDHIGDEIQKKSGILISGTTIRRLANGEFSRLPQVATLNAVASYFNYKTWQDYKTHNSQNGTGKEPPVEMVNTPTRKATRSKAGLIGLCISAILIAIAGAYFWRSDKGSVNNAEKASFSFRKNTSNEIPNSVVFSYNIDEVQADSFFIQQSWDQNRKVRIYKKNYTLTDIYYEPGYHIAKLIANDSVIRQADVSIPTDRWFFYAIDNVANYTPEYIKPDSFINNGSLRLTEQDLQKSNIDVSKDKRYHYVYFHSQFNVPSDNFSYKTRIRMKPVRNSFCPYIEVELYCQRSFMLMRGTTKGCAHEAFIEFGEQKMSGHDTDLLPIAFDVGQWTNLEITVKNKVATVKINEKEVFSTRYVTDTRYLTGLGYISNGLCEVDKVELTGLDGKVMYKNDF